MGYDQRRSIRAQIRIVRRLLEERSPVLVKGEGKPEQATDGDISQFLGESQDDHLSRHPYTVVQRQMSPIRQERGGPDSVSPERRPDYDDDDSYRKPCPESKREPSCPDVKDSKTHANRPESYSTFPRDSKPVPEKIPDWKSSLPRKSSKSELNVELKPAAPSSGEC